MIFEYCTRAESALACVCMLHSANNTNNDNVKVLLQYLNDEKQPARIVVAQKAKWIIVSVPLCPVCVWLWMWSQHNTPLNVGWQMKPSLGSNRKTKLLIKWCTYCYADAHAPICATTMTTTAREMKDETMNGIKLNFDFVYIVASFHYKRKTTTLSPWYDSSSMAKFVHVKWFTSYSERLNAVVLFIRFESVCVCVFQELYSSSQFAFVKETSSTTLTRTHTQTSPGTQSKWQW